MNDLQPITGDRREEILHSGQPELLTVDEAARILRVSKSTMYAYVSRGQLKRSVCRGRPLLFRRDMLVEELWRSRR